MTEVFMAFTISFIFGVGIYMILRRDIMKIAVGFCLISHAVNLTLMTSSLFRGALPPVLTGVTNENATFIWTDDLVNGTLAPIVIGTADSALYADPLPQALVLTAIVISFATTAIFLALVYRIGEEYGTTDVDELRRLHG
jgi:multicomponent Na+:H+ antiporter subunit C